MNIVAVVVALHRPFGRAALLRAPGAPVVSPACMRVINNNSILSVQVHLTSLVSFPEEFIVVVFLAAQFF